jgi:hypothetical protein
MVIDGSRIRKEDFSLQDLQLSRVYLPPRFVRQAGLTGEKPVDCWLMVVAAGRYRLFTPATPDPEGDLSRLLSLMEEVSVDGGALDWTENNEQPASVIRLIPCAASPRGPGPGWRIHIPQEARYLAPEGKTAGAVYLIIVGGLLEIWFPRTLQQAVSVPLSRILR